jgi:hypothetical protein
MILLPEFMGGSHVVQTAVRPDLVVIVPRCFNDQASLAPLAESLQVQSSIVEFAIGALVVTFLPRLGQTAQRCADGRISNPLLDGTTDELLSIV